MIDALAAASGIAETYTDYFGNVKRVSRDTKRAILNALGYDIETDRDASSVLHDMDVQKRNETIQNVYVVRAGRHVDLPFFRGVLEAGYHRFDAGAQNSTVIAAPERAYVPPALEDGPAWGFAAQLYSLRSSRNWGIGDFGDLAKFARIATSLDAQTISLNPLHQLHLADPARASPYSPLSRLYLNALYIDVDGAARDLGIELDRPNVEPLRAAEFVDYAGVAHAKLPALRALYEAFHTCSDERKRRFREFQKSGGVALRRMAIYEALSVQFAGGWMEWPHAYHRPDATAVAAFADEHRFDIEFYEFLQWLADTQLGEAAREASQMSVGLYRDLAVGVDAQSLDVWADRDAFCLGLSIGAPPDALNANGQNWGLPPLNPRVLRERAYAPFAAVLRANMQYAGALRIDHVMGLMRLFVIPEDASPKDGAYLEYPFEDLAGVLALESMQNRCMVVGEDLGTLPEGFRDRMHARRFFSTRLLYFEREDDGTFYDPSRYPHYAVASTGTHDLPPLAGFWRSLGKRDRMQLRELLGGGPENDGDLALVTSSYRTLARTNAALLLLQLEDALLQLEAVNVPGTTVEAPNWRRKLPVAVDVLQDDARFATIVAELREARSRARSE